MRNKYCLNLEIKLHKENYENVLFSFLELGGLAYSKMDIYYGIFSNPLENKKFNYQLICDFTPHKSKKKYSNVNIYSSEDQLNSPGSFIKIKSRFNKEYTLLLEWVFLDKTLCIEIEKGILTNLKKLDSTLVYFYIYNQFKIEKVFYPRSREERSHGLVSVRNKIIGTAPTMLFGKGIEPLVSFEDLLGDQESELIEFADKKLAKFILYDEDLEGGSEKEKLFWSRYNLNKVIKEYDQSFVLKDKEFRAKLFDHSSSDKN